MSLREHRIDALLAPARAQYERALSNHDRNIALHQLGVARANLSALSDEAIERALQQARTDGGVVARTDATATEQAARFDSELEAARQRGIEAKQQLAKPEGERKDVASWHGEQNWRQRLSDAHAAAAGAQVTRSDADPVVSAAQGSRDARHALASRSK